MDFIFDTDRTQVNMQCRVKANVSQDKWKGEVMKVDGVEKRKIYIYM
jgi:hypothetical protein